MRKAFTLIETIVVVAVIGLTLPVLFAIIFTLIRQQVKIYRLSQIKREGDYVINLMENTIRNKAVTIHSGSPANDTNIVCGDDLVAYPLPAGTTVNNLYFLDEDNIWFGYKLNVSTSTVVSDSVTPVNLTSSKIIVSDFFISCSKTAVYSPASVLLDFDICYDTGSGDCTLTRPEEFTLMHYHTRIKLRTH